ncbi:hypothetical protein J4727_07985, partial [Providencia rettgeri]|nr:hypothetical protein [Providencia rettgeri]
YQQLIQNYPELADRVNPVAAFFSQPRVCFLFSFISSYVLGKYILYCRHRLRISIVIIAVAMIFIFYLYLSDALFFLKKKDTFGAIFLLVDFLFSIMVLTGIYVFIMSVIADVVNTTKGGNNQGTIMFSGMFLLMIIWQIVPKTKGIPN